MDDNQAFLQRMGVIIVEREPSLYLGAAFCLLGRS